jgi:hypothetical protein
MPQPDDQRCSACRFFTANVAALDPRLSEDLGWCQRYPPSQSYFDQASNRQITRFTTTDKDWWCGEYKPGPQAPQTEPLS